MERLKALASEAETVSSAASVLGWDQETNLPPDGGPWRAKQLSWLSGRHHEMVTSEAWKSAIEEALANCDEEDSRASRNLTEMRRQFERKQRLPTELVERASSLSSRAKQVWSDARKHDDFLRFAPLLEELVGIAREKAELWGYADEPYDALLETYERGATTAKVASIFEGMGSELREISQAAVDRFAANPVELPAGPYPEEAQARFNREVAEALGFDFSMGRIDTTTHPFCTTLGPADVRLTTRYDLDDFTSSLFGVMHEAGHGLYEQGLRAEDYGTPAGDAVSLGIHESQSRLWENHIGRSRAFWDRWFPVACKHFPQLEAFGLDAFMGFVQRSEKSFIRVEADEATYDLHILLRFDLERRLVQGDLQVKDVPAAWNERFEAGFGITPPNDREGCLQDIHWAMGGLGYFPTYSLGNLNAAQLFEAARAVPDIATGIDRSDYAPLLAWLREKVHCHGGTLDPDEIIRDATGNEPSPEAHLRHLRKRYVG
ncbi:carboxypeptidase M32 [Haloferula helveola]|uniref:Metal-dependent carboxypeptidase n=2 Tax=Haloferula helveola TaxID=490095 RepID=A0ABN6H9L3_9BACT|nr:carboxypeptidase M32 [Haloferula helveola]